jgi:hypothetical protein
VRIRSATVVVAALVSAMLPATALADPLPAAYSGSTVNNIIGIDVNALGFNIAGLQVAHTDTNVASQASPRTSAEAANMAAAVAGVSVPIASVQQTAPPDNTSSTSTGLTQVDIPGLLDTGALTGTVQARWAGDGSCPSSGTALSTSTVQMAGLTLGNAVTELAQLGAASTSGTTSLVSNGGPGDSRSVVSGATGNIASLTFLNDVVNVNFGGAPTLTATASGSAGGASVSYVPPSVTVTAPGVNVPLTPGAQVTVSVPLVGSVTIRMGIPTISTTADGQNAVGDVSLLSVEITLLGGAGTASLGILPLHAESHAPPGGVQCGLLDAPTITSPTNGSTTQDTTPTITGTGVPGAILTVKEGGTVIGTAVVAADGSWSLTPSSPLPLGSHTVTAEQSLGSAGSAPSAPTTFSIVDITPPAAPVITAPADGSVTNDNTPLVTGTAEPGSTVTVTVGGTTYTTTAGPAGNWSVPVTTPLADGPYPVTATATDGSGNVSPAASNNFTVDTTAAPPVITAPTNGSATNDPTPAITGTAEPDATVQVVVDGVVVGTTTAAADGSWSLPVTTPLADGPHTVSASQTDPVGNVSAPATSTFTVDTTAPARPVITGPADQTTIGDNTPTITGTAEPGATVTVLVDGTVIGTTVADASGQWSLNTTTPLADGPHQVRATQTDAAGNTSQQTINNFTVDTSAAAPTISSPVSGTVTNDSTPPFSGTGEPGATVTVTTSTGTVLGTALVDPAGNWTLTPTTPLPDGSYTVTATQTDPVGNVSPSSSPVIFTVDTTVAAPVVSGPAPGSTTADSTPTISGAGEPGATVTVSVDGTVVGTAVVATYGSWALTPSTPLADGSHTATATQTDPAGNVSPASAPDTFTIDTTPPAAPVIVTPADGSVTNDPTPTYAGTAEPLSTITVVVDGTVVGTAPVDVTGRWTLTPLAPLADGPHMVQATATDAVGNTGAPASNAFVVDTAAPAAPVITGPADGSHINDNTPTITGTAEPGAIVAVVVDGVSLGTVTADPLTGLWSLPVTTPLADGKHSVTATAMDAAGNTSPAATSTFTVDTAAPASPAVTSPANGSSTNDATPVVTGTGEPGSTIEVVVDGVAVGTATVTQNGSWGLPLTTPLSDGPHTVTATSTDVAGNTSPPSAPVTFTVDGNPPAPPAILTPANGSWTADTTPLISGTAEPGATVTVTVDGTVLGITVAAPGGTWSVPVATPLADGSHTASATATDAAGNISAPTTNTFNVDTLSPSAPVITSPADGSVNGDNTPSIVGTAEPGASVTVSVDGVVIGAVVADAKGEWFLDVTTPLADGLHTVSAIQTDRAGNVSPATSNGFTVDTTVAAPTISIPQSGTIINDATPLIAGTGEPGATVTVTTSTGQVLATAVVDASGTWAFNSVSLPDGTYTITASQVDLGGNVSQNSAAAIFTVDTGVAPPVISTPADGSLINDSTPLVTGTAEPGATVTVYVDGVAIGTAVADVTTGAWQLPVAGPIPDGTHAISAVATDLAGNVSTETVNQVTIDTTAPLAPAITGPADGAVTTDHTPTITGTAEPGATVTVVVDGVTIGTVVAGPGGNWSLPVSTPLADGLHVVEATATDPAGNTSLVATSSFTVDSTAPAAPVITGPADGSVTGDSTPTVTGTAEPGATVTVVLAGTTYPTTADPSTGAWSVQVTTPLTDGPYTVTATATDAAGNTSPAASNAFTVDTTVAAPVITAPTSGTVTNDNTPTITGTAEPGATVTVTTSTGQVLGTVTADGTGAWTLTPAALPDATYTITATQSDPAGNTSGASSSVIFTVDTTVAPPVITGPLPGTLTSDNTPTVTGTGEPGATVTVYVDGSPVGTATVDASAAWTFPIPAPLADGAHTLTATQVDAAGNPSPPSAPVGIVVDTTPPPAPAVSSPAPGSVTSDPTPAVTGTAEPNTTVTVVIDGSVVGTTTAAADGSWTFTPPTALPDGLHTVGATATDRAGNVSVPSATVSFTVDTTPPAAPVITGPADGSTVGDNTPTVTGTAEPGAAIVVVLDGTTYTVTADATTGVWSIQVTTPLADGPYTVTATATDIAGNISPVASSGFTVDTTAAPPVITNPANGAVTNDPTPAITGTAEPGATVTVTIDGTVIATTTADGTGAWTVTPGSPLADGAHTVTATQTDPTGNTSGASSSVVFTVDTTAAAPVITGPASGALTNDPTPAITGTAEPGATVTVTIDGTVVGTTTADGTGAWTVTPGSPLADGTHTVTATQTDPAGNTSPTSAGVTFNVDTTPPAAPVITAPADGTVTADPTPTVSGTAAPGSVVEVVVDGTVVGTTTAAPDGSWSLPLTDPLGDGPHTIEATATDRAGNTSPAANTGIVVDTRVLPPVITGPADGSSTADHTPLISGTGEPGATVEVSVDGVVVGTATVGPGGNWSLPVTDPLASGQHTVSATQTDVAGNTSSAATSTFTVTQAAPPAPVITSPAPGSTTDDTTPSLSGTGTPGATITVSIDHHVVGTTTVRAGGHWSLTVPEALSCGWHVVTATQTVRHHGQTLVSQPSKSVRIKVACEGGMPNMGAPSGVGSLALLGLLLLGAGVALIRRRPSPPTG